MTTSRGGGTTEPRARYAYLRSDGTAFIVVGSLVAGLGAYAYQFLGGRTLGAEAFAPVSVLLTIHFLTFIVILMPIEQLIVRRLTIDRSRLGLPAQAWWLAGLTVAGATLFAWLGVDRFLNGDRRFIVFTGLVVGFHVLFAAGRGHLAGWRRFRAYGMTSGAASLLRLVVALAVTLIRPSASGLALGLVAGPLVVLAWDPFRRVEVDRPELETHHAEAIDDRGLLSGLVLATAASQVLLLAGPIVAGGLGATAAEISIVFATFTLGRAPLTFGYNLLARVLPPFTEMAARGERRELRAWARGMTWAALALSLVAAVLGWLLGPWVIQVAFGAEFVPSRLVAAGVAFGVIFAGAGLFVGQILVARGRPVRLAIAWVSGLIAGAAAIAIMPGLGSIGRVTAGFLAGETVALFALMAGVMTMDREYVEPKPGTTAAYVLAKRTMDIAISLVALVLTIPILVIAAIAVRIDSPGPIFFRQLRVGRNGDRFGLLKIRTMSAEGGEEVFAEHLERLQASRFGEGGQTIRIEEDKRITRVGRFLRRWSLDELPNLWTVLRGQMSLVGPRPLVEAEAELIGLDNPRFQVKPGITGLAQVRGRDAISLEKRTRFDEEYVDNRSIRTDLSILGRTALTVIKSPGD